MARYKVSYKVLREQGEELKAAAKLMDGYTERVNQIRGKLGSDEMLASVRNNLQKLAVQMGESRAIINMAGGVLTQSVEGYATLENRQVKKVDALKAHNRDFYKNPVVVASAGGAAAGGSAAGTAASANTAAGTATAAGPTTVEYTQNNTVINYSVSPEAANTSANTPAVSFAAPSSAGAGTAAAGAGAQKSAAVGAGIAAGAGALGAAAGAGAAYAAGRVKKRRDEQKKTGTEKADAPPEDDPEVQLAQAIERVKRLGEEDEGTGPS